MDNQTQPNIPPFQPQKQTSNLPSTNWVKVLLLIIIGLIAIAASVFVGIQIGKKQITNQQPIIKQPTLFPTQTIVNQVIIPTTTLTTKPNPTINSTADWKTYINKDVGITFDYPKDWKIIDNQGPTYILLYPPESNPELPSDNISFNKEDKLYIPEPTPNNCMTPYKPYVINNIAARITEDTNKCGPRTGGCSSLINIEFPLNNKILTISYCTRDRIRSEEIIKTLKIIK